MKQKTVSAVVITASDGMTITNRINTIFSKEIWLGVHDSPDNYYEISDDEVEYVRGPLTDQ